MSGLLIEVRVLGGHPIRDAIADMCRLADKLGITVAANCNDVRVVAPPRSDDYALFLNWERGRDRAEKETSVARLWKKRGDDDPACANCGRTWDMHIVGGHCPTANRATGPCDHDFSPTAALCVKCGLFP